MEPGTWVYDGDDDEPTLGVVVGRPEGTTIADWEYEVDGETYTTAESNPDYPEDEQLVLITFAHMLESQWPDWQDASSSDLFDEVREREIPHYGFPESRVEPAPESDVEAFFEGGETGEGDADADEGDDTVPPEFDEITDRLEENGFDVERDDDAAELHVEKYGTEYVVAADGTVTGDEGLRNRVTSIVNRYL